MFIQTNPSIRIRPPSELSDGNWLVENYMVKHRYSLNDIGIYLLIYCMDADKYENIIRHSMDELKVTENTIRNIIDLLLQKQLLVNELSNEAQEFKNIQKEWSEYGWIEAAEYHLSTLNYKFLEDRNETIQQMREYGNQEPDIARSKTYSSSINNISLNDPTEDMCPFPVSNLWDKKHSNKRLDKNTFFEMIAMTFGKVDILKTGWNGAPILRKTSPSGGARHPSEGYVLVKDIVDLQPGWYHFSADPPQLELINEDYSSEADLKKLFSLTYANSNFSFSAIVIITSVFERNMYRYREPRTFRSIHMDAGHLCGTLESLASAFGFKSYVQYGIDEEKIEQILDINELDEGYQASIAIGS